MRQKLLTALTVSVLAVTISTPAFAQDDLRGGLRGVINRFQTAENQATRSAAKQTQELSNIIQRADTLITNRINELNKLATRIQNDQRLSSDEKTSLTNDVQTDINGLNTLKTKIDADTTVADARTDGKGIFTDFRVYEYFTPKTQLLITIDNLQTLAGNLATLTPKLQNLINELKGQGKDMTDAQNLLTDINTQLSTINTTLTSDKTEVNGVTLNSTNYKTTFTSVRKDLADVRANFAKIRSDIGQMRNAIQPATGSATIKTSTGSSTPSSTSATPLDQ